jgi:hypothetical protein
VRPGHLASHRTHEAPVPAADGQTQARATLAPAEVKKRTDRHRLGPPWHLRRSRRGGATQNCAALPVDGVGTWLMGAGKLPGRQTDRRMHARTEDRRMSGLPCHTPHLLTTSWIGVAIGQHGYPEG